LVCASIRRCGTRNFFPDHLRVRVEVVDNRDQVLGTSRDLREIQTQLHSRARAT